MIRIIDARNRAAHIATLVSMYEDRKRLFVDLLKWDVPIIDDRYEMDAFDDANATYVVAVDEDGAHRGSLRLLPSVRPHLLDTLFGALCPNGAPRGEATYEITRLCLPARYRTAERLAIRNALIAAMVDQALMRGITRLTGVVEDRFRKEILSMGWLCEPIGPALRIDGALLGAFAVHIQSDTPARLRWTGIYPQEEATVVAASAVA